VLGRDHDQGLDDDLSVIQRGYEHKKLATSDRKVSTVSAKTKHLACHRDINLV